MISVHLILAATSLILLFLVKINSKVDFIRSAKSLLRLAQVLFVLSILGPVVFNLLPDQHHPLIPSRYTFPAEEINSRLDKKLTFAPLNQSQAATVHENVHAASTFATPDLSVNQLIITAYAILICFGFFRFFLNIFRIKQFLKNSQIIKKYKNVRIALSEEIAVPFSVLAGRTAWVVIPSSMLFDRKDFFIALNHELQHHKQKDTAWILFMELTGIVLFINPAFYLWKQLFSELQEFSCDEALINGQRISLHDYGDCLVRVAEAALENRSRLVGTASLTLMFGNPKKINSILIRRIKMFKQHLSSRLQWGRFMAVGITTMLFTLAIAYGATAKLEQKPKEEMHPGTLILDPEIQKIAENVLKNAVKRFKATSGFALVSEPKSGRLLAVANTITTPESHTPPHWALKLRLEPASAMKALVAAKTVDLKLTTFDEKFDCHNGKLEYGGNIYKDWKAFDKLSTRDMVVYSSNICAMEVVQRLGAKNTFAMLNDFGFGSGGSTENFPEARFGQSFSFEDINNSHMLGNVGTGYVIHATPLEMVQAFGAIANGGNLMRPIMANDPDSKISIVRRVLSEKTAKETQDVLREVMTRGTAQEQESKIYNLAGKTATASSPWLWDSNEQGGENNVGSFVGFGPVEDAKVLIYVGIYEPKDLKDHSAHGSSHGAPVFREIAEKVLQHMKVAPTISKN